MPKEPQRRVALIDELVSMLRTSVAYTVMVSQAAADRIGINTTDLHSLNMVAFSEREVSAGDLAGMIGLTTASITGIVDRLEREGLVRRVRDPQDRRRVVIELIPENTRERVAPVFAPLLAEWQAELSRYSDRELDLILEFQQRTLEIMKGQVTRLRQPRPPDASPAKPSRRRSTSEVS